ncbi:response regulator transcription factor [Paenibacillus sp. J2TS4]|uniref:response regulator transcription factor n=1 Tax=Paenibacillus sp. J2TS4 TaxID=2807194 RepID=UPI001B160048|nr:response regulator transcription factor [Paenibacillus sp. J2TS4]GIP33811.1 putative transcriptional regulatory protein YkoG [Paenibacillus sp. J2TS4]
MRKNLLYIEDDPEIGQWVSDNLTERGYRVTWLTSGDRAGEHMSDSDLVLLDVMLPGLDGFSVGQRLKKDYPQTPILMISARTSIEDKLQGLVFADDYVTKPFHPDELAARIEVLLRRFGPTIGSCLTLGHLHVYPEENRLVDQRTENEIILTGKQFQIFMYLLRHANQIMTKEQIFEAVWGEPYMEGDKTLMVHIRYLREKIEEDPGNPKIIETIRGIGYRVRS